MTQSTIPPSPSGKDYTQDPDYKAQAQKNALSMFHRNDPIELAKEWLAEARVFEANDSNAMSLATVDAEGRPDVRIVLLKGVDERGFVFYSNQDSAKGLQLESNPVAALCLHWKSLRRQVRVRGDIVRVSEAEADAYFASRARGSQIGAWASDQSRPLESRELFEDRLKATEKEYAQDEEIARPPYWGGWRVEPKEIEFWRDRPFRLHDRMRFIRKDGVWSKERLFP